MSSSLVEIYLSQNILLLVSCTLLAASRLLPRQPSPAQRLWLAWALLAASVAAPLAAPQRFERSFLPVTTQIWSGTGRHAAGLLHPSATATVSVPATGTQLPLSMLAGIVLACLSAGLVLALIRIVRGVTATRAILAAAHPVRRAGSLAILATSAAGVPFSFWTPGRCYIVVPLALLARAGQLRLALRHEAQHHRQGDTRLLYLLEIVKGAFFLNPAAHWLCRHISEQQELACDTAVVGGGDPGAYCGCLLWIAESTLAQRAAPPLTAGMGRSLLARRVALLLQGGRPPLSVPAACATFAATILAIVLGAVALAGTVEDRRVDAAQAAALATRAQADTTFPIVMNEQVLAQLNRLLGTPAGRAFIRAGLQRMHASEGLIAPRLLQLGLPPELKALPLVESGYRNRPPDGNPAHGAGLWMFIAPTARASGLTVDSTLDERLDPALESDAAARLLSSLYGQLGDWHLVVLAFNAGDAYVERSISEAGTRDAFRLTQLGHENDPGYLAQVMAAIIIMKNEEQLSLE